MGHIDTRRKLREIPLLSEFEDLLNLCTLSDEDKEILWLHYIQRRDFRFIAEKLGYSEKTIKDRHHEALKILSYVL